jgi:phage terminase small subunit
MRGRKPRPTALKILRGERSDRINDCEIVLSPAEVDKPPAWLGRYGVELWQQYARVLADAGLLTVGDLIAFEQLCDEYDSVRRDPLDAFSRDRLRRWVVEFGLTPSARSRVKSAAAAPVDKMAAFLARQSKGKKRA